MVGALIGFLWYNTLSRRRSSWATPARSRSAARWARWRSCSSRSSCSSSSARVFVAETISVILQRFVFKYRRRRYGLEYAQRAPRLSPSAAPPSLRGEGVERAAGRRAVLDHRDHRRLPRPQHAQAPLSMPVRSLTEALPATWTRGEIASSAWRAVAARRRSCSRAPARRSTRSDAGTRRRGAARGARARAARRRRAAGRTRSRAHRGERARRRQPGRAADAPPLAAARDGRRADRQRAGDRARSSSRASATSRSPARTARRRRRRSSHRLLEGLGYDAVAAGNIGTPLAEVALREQRAGLDRARDVVVPAARHAEHRAGASAC